MNYREEYFLKSGEKVPGVTTVISNLGWSTPALNYYYWERGKEGKKFKKDVKEAAQAGSIAHYLIECHIKNSRPNIPEKFPFVFDGAPEKAEKGYLNFREWTDLVKFRPFLTEHKLVSEEHGYGTRLDCIGFLGDRLGLIDWKTSNDVYDDHKIQLAAGGKLWEENNPDKPLDGYHLLRFSKEEAEFAHHFWASLPLYWEVFLHLLGIEKLKRKLRRR